MADQPKPTKKYASTLDVLKQSVREKFSDTEIHEDPAVRAQIDKVENHKKVVTDLSRHLTALKKSHTQGKAEEKNLIESWTVYADKLSTAAECPELEKAMRKLILVEKYVEEITGKMNDTYGEKVVTPVHNYGDTELRDALRWKDRYNDIRVRYDALCAKKSSSEKHAQDKVECQKDLSKMGEQTIEALKKAYARSEFVHFEAIIGRYEALVEFFDLGQLYMNERKAEIAQFKADFERRKLELATGKKVDVTRAPGGATVFGVPLLELLGREKRPDTDVPLLVEKCCEYLYAKGLDSEGLFRVSPAGSQLEKFKTEANRGSYDFSWITDPNVVAGGLKFFLRSLPDPIFTAERYRGWLNCIGRGDETLELEALKKLIENLPPQNLVIVKTIMLLLKAVLEHEEKNKMTPKALCVVMGPNLIWSREATKPEDMMVDAEKTNALLTLMMKNVPFLFTEKNIWKLIKRGDVDGTRKLAESEKVDLLTSADETGQYALHVAAKLGFLPMVKYMIEEVKMPVDQKDLLEVTALGHALMNKNEDVALYLVEKRANTRSDFKDKVDFESRAKLCGQPFFTKYQELVLKVNKEEREKAEAEAKRKADEKDRAEKEVAAKLRAEEEARWAKELEVAQKRAARENPALAALGAQVVPGPPPPVSVDPQELARAAERERAERAQAEKERAEREEKEREERRKLLDRERDQMLQEKEAKRLKEIADQKAQEEREREERERIVAEKERDRLAAMDRALQDSRASMAPPMPLTRPSVPLPRPPGGSARAAPTPQAQPALRSSAGGIAPRNPPGDADPDAPPTPLGLSNRSRVSSTPTAPSLGVQSSSAAPAALLPTPQAAPAAAAAAPASDDAALPRLEQLLLNNKLNLPELLAAVCRLVRLCVASALDLPACNTAVRELAVEVKGLFNHGDAEVLAESSDEDRDALFAQARKLQDGMKQVIGALKELSQSAEPADRVPALLRSLAFIVGPAVGVFSAFEAVVGAQVAGLTGAAANQLTTALQIAVGKAPATELPALAEASASHYSALAEIVRLKALEVADPEAEEKLSQAANTLLSSRAALFQTASTLLATPSDDMAKANLSAVAKVLAAQFSLLNTHAAALPLHRTVSAAGRAAADAQEERDIRSLRDLMGMLSLPDPDIGRRLSAALEGLLLLRSLPVTQGILYFDACHRVAEAVRSAARHTLSMRQVQASPALQREVTRATAAAVHLAAFAEVIGSAHALNLALDPEAALNHVVAGLLHALSLLARHLSTL